MAFSLITVFHKVNKFLGNPGGELLKLSSEFALLTFASYMVASEWLRTKSRHLKYLLIGFGSLALQKIIAILFLAQQVFTQGTLGAYHDAVDLTRNFLEIGALILISSAFLYGVHEKHHISLRRKTYIELGGLAVLFVFLAAVAFEVFPFQPFGIKRKVIYAAMELAKFAILWFPVFTFWKQDELTTYNKAVALAFIVYSITPLVVFFNKVLYYGGNPDLAVIAHPFPFLGIALFSRVLFLKLVDKATLKEELTVTRQKYIREKEVGAMKDEFVSTVSHELRTPLTSLRLYLKLLLQGKFGELNGKQKETVETIEKESGRLTKLINDILDLSRYEKHKEQLRLQRVRLRKLVDSCIYPHLTEQKNVKIINEIPGGMIAHLDGEKFRQVIINMLTNAIKHTEEGNIVLSARMSKRWVMITIADTGCGIPREALPYIFDRFYQVEHHLVRKTGGIGLGLAIAKNIVELHGGTINVKSAVGKGTAFIIAMPEKPTYA